MTHGEQGGQESHNLARFFVEHRQVAWALLVAVMAWGVAGYSKMPKRKDPDIPVRVGLAVCPWPGISADRVEELVTRKIEQAVSGNSKIEKVVTTSRDGVAIVLVHLDDKVSDTIEQFADIGQRVTHIPDLPNGAGPVTWVSDFGDTAALMLTVASPKVGQAEIRIRGEALRKAIEKVRAGGPPTERVSALYCFPPTVVAVRGRSRDGAVRCGGDSRRRGSGNAPRIGGRLHRPRSRDLAHRLAAPCVHRRVPPGAARERRTSIRTRGGPCSSGSPPRRPTVSPRWRATSTRIASSTTSPTRSSGSCRASRSSRR